MIRLPRRDSESDLADEPPTSSKRPHLDEDSYSSNVVSERMRSYKDNLHYNPEWKKKWPWIEHKEEEGGMFCSICKKYERGTGRNRKGIYTCTQTRSPMMVYPRKKLSSEN